MIKDPTLKQGHFRHMRILNVAEILVVGKKEDAIIARSEEASVFLPREEQAADGYSSIQTHELVVQHLLHDRRETAKCLDGPNPDPGFVALPEELDHLRPRVKGTLV